MKILLLDDEIINFYYLRSKFINHNIEYIENPVTWLDKVYKEKINLNQYNFIFCDFNFENLIMDCFELKLSFYIRICGFKNYLILFSNLTFFDLEKIKQKEYFDLILDKMVDISISEIEKLCINSILRPFWQKRIR